MIVRTRKIIKISEEDDSLSEVERIIKSTNGEADDEVISRLTFHIGNIEAISEYIDTSIEYNNKEDKVNVLFKSGCYYTILESFEKMEQLFLNYHK